MPPARSSVGEARFLVAGAHMEAAMRQRLDLAEVMLRERTQLLDFDRTRQEVMEEFEIVLTQMPYVGGAAATFFESRA